MQVEMTKEEAVLVLSAIGRMELAMLDPRDKVRRELFARIQSSLKQEGESVSQPAL